MRGFEGDVEEMFSDLNDVVPRGARPYWAAVEHRVAVVSMEN